MTSARKDHGGMDQISKKYASDEVFREVANLLFGDGLIAKANPDGMDLSTHERKKQKRKEFGENVAIATNTAGAIAGPAAIYQAARSRKTGGMPRDAMRSGKLGGRLKNLAHKLDSPTGRKAKIGAGLAGGAMVGLQVANMTGDTIAARTLSQNKKEKKKDIHKAYAEGSSGCFPTSKGKLVKVGADKAAPKVKKTGQGALKKLKQDVIQVETVGKVLDGPSVEISKLDEDKRQVFGWASVVEKNGQPVVDLQGDFIPVEEMERAGYDYVRKSRKAGDMHARDGMGPRVVGEMIESFVVTPEKKQALGLSDDIPTGWWVGFQIEDDQVWADIKSGKRTGFSVHGTGKRTPLDA